MGRAPRQFVSGATYHLWARGSNRQLIFLNDPDRIDFLECLSRVIRRSGIRCLAYCLMPNHYHLVVESGESDLSRAMQALNGRYALRFNRRHERDAHVFRNRFGANRQETDAQLLWTLRYVVSNPVDAGLCRGPDHWPWSSYRSSAGLDRAPPFLDVARVLSYFGDSPDQAGRVYRAFIHDLVGV